MDDRDVDKSETDWQPKWQEAHATDATGSQARDAAGAGTLEPGWTSG
jgi:hypothetical protein